MQFVAGQTAHPTGRHLFHLVPDHRFHSRGTNAAIPVFPSINSNAGTGGAAFVGNCWCPPWNTNLVDTVLLSWGPIVVYNEMYIMHLVDSAYIRCVLTARVPCTLHTTSAVV